MKAIMISIQPQWVEKILNGEKTIEIRKTKPSCELPCKVYIYCTKGKKLYKCVSNFDEDLLNGKVVAEFTLNNVEKIKFDCPCSFSSFNMGFGFTENRYNIDVTKTCLTESQLYDYLGEPFEIQGEYHQTFEFGGYAWCIDDLKIYDKPKELSEFKKDLDCDDYPCNKNRDCKYNYYDTSEGCWACGIDFDGTNCIYKQIKTPPKSWCYVEELENE